LTEDQKARYFCVTCGKPDRQHKSYKGRQKLREQKERKKVGLFFGGTQFEGTLGKGLKEKNREREGEVPKRNSE